MIILSIIESNNYDSEKKITYFPLEARIDLYFKKIVICSDQHIKFL